MLNGIKGFLANEVGQDGSKNITIIELFNYKLGVSIVVIIKLLSNDNPKVIVYFQRDEVFIY